MDVADSKPAAEEEMKMKTTNRNTGTLGNGLRVKTALKAGIIAILIGL